LDHADNRAQRGIVSNIKKHILHSETAFVQHGFLIDPIERHRELKDLRRAEQAFDDGVSVFLKLFR